MTSKVRVVDQMYPLEIVAMSELESSGPTISYYSKGHHSIELFTQAMREYFAGELGQELNLDCHYAIHVYMRYVPFDGDAMWAQVPTREGPGAFPVTYLEVDWQGARPSGPKTEL